MADLLDRVDSFVKGWNATVEGTKATGRAIDRGTSGWRAPTALGAAGLGLGALIGFTAWPIAAVGGAVGWGILNVARRRRAQERAEAAYEEAVRNSVGEAERLEAEQAAEAARLAKEAAVATAEAWDPKIREKFAEYAKYQKPLTDALAAGQQLDDVLESLMDPRRGASQADVQRALALFEYRDQQLWRGLDPADRALLNPVPRTTAADLLDPDGNIDFAAVGRLQAQVQDFNAQVNGIAEPRAELGREIRQILDVPPGERTEEQLNSLLRCLDQVDPAVATELRDIQQANRPPDAPTPGPLALTLPPEESIDVGFIGWYARKMGGKVDKLEGRVERQERDLERAEREERMAQRAVNDLDPVPNLALLEKDLEEAKKGMKLETYWTEREGKLETLAEEKEQAEARCAETSEELKDARARLKKVDKQDGDIYTSRKERVELLEQQLQADLQIISAADAETEVFLGELASYEEVYTPVVEAKATLDAGQELQKTTTEKQKALDAAKKKHDKAKEKLDGTKRELTDTTATRDKADAKVKAKVKDKQEAMAAAVLAKINAENEAREAAERAAAAAQAPATSPPGQALQPRTLPQGQGPINQPLPMANEWQGQQQYWDPQQGHYQAPPGYHQFYPQHPYAAPQPVYVDPRYVPQPQPVYAGAPQGYGGYAPGPAYTPPSAPPGGGRTGGHRPFGT